MSDTPPVTQSISQGVMTLTLVREPHNWLEFKLLERLNQLLEQAEEAPEVRVIHLRAEGEAFCRGMDPDYLYQLQSLELQDNVADSAMLGSVYKRLARGSKLTLAEVQGPAISEGAGLLAACDLVVASDTTEVSLPDVRYANIPAVAIHACLKRIPVRVLRRMTLTGHTLAGEALLSEGWVDELLPANELTERAATFAQQLAQQNALSAVPFLKKCLADLPGFLGDEGLTFAAKINGHGRFNAEFKRGLQARKFGHSVDWFTETRRD